MSVTLNEFRLRTIGLKRQHWFIAIVLPAWRNRDMNIRGNKLPSFANLDSSGWNANMVSNSISLLTLNTPFSTLMRGPIGVS